MTESKDFSAEAGNAKVVGTVSSSDIAEPVAPPLGMRAVGPRITFHFVGEWNADTSYVLYDVVRVNGTSYIANKINIAKGVNPETDNNVHWVKWNDPNAQVELLQQTVNAFDGRITEAETEAMHAVADATEAKKASANNATAIEAEATRAKTAEATNTATIEAEAARAKTAEAANTSAIEAEAARATVQKQMDGIKNAKFLVFSDDSATSTDGETVWDYLKTILNNPNLDITIKTAPENVGWSNKNATNLNANEFVKQESTLISDRDSYDFVILNFGWYDIKNNNHSSDYENLGRQIVNTVKELYQNAVTVVNPVSNNYCYNYNRSMQLEFYSLNYGMVRSQVPIRIVPWYLAFNVNQLADNHYSGADANPYRLNSGGTESIGAIIKEALFGNMHGFLRGSRYMLSNYVSNYFTAQISEFMFDPITLSCKLTAGTLTAKQSIAHSSDDIVLGKAESGYFNVQDDTILAACIQNTQNEPLKGFLVMKANNDVVFRMASSTTTISDGAILRLLPTGAFIPAVNKG